MFYQFTFPPEVQGGFPFLRTINAGEGVLAILTGVSAFIFINSFWGLLYLFLFAFWVGLQFIFKKLSIGIDI